MDFRRRPIKPGQPPPLPWDRGRFQPEPKRSGPTPPPLPRRVSPFDGPRFHSGRERYGEIDLAAPLNEWVSVTSTWVESIKFEPDYDMLGLMLGTGELWVEFLDGAVVSYRDIPVEMWGEFVNSSSKGMFMHYRIVGRNYTLHQSGHKAVTPEKRKERDTVNPITGRPWGFR